MRERGFFFREPEFILVFVALILAGSVASCSLAPRPSASVPDLYWPSPPGPPRVKFIGTFSTLEDLGVKRPWIQKISRFLTGARPPGIRLTDPTDVFSDGRGTYYITDTSTRSVHILDRLGKTYREISSAGETQLYSPIGIAALPDGRLFVSDSLLGAVFVYDGSGTYLRSIGQGELERPTGIALDGLQQRLYVADTTAHAVKVFDLDGRPLFSIGGRGNTGGKFNFPTCLALDRGGRLFVGDTLNFRIQVFDRDGRFVTHFGAAGDGTGYFSQIKGLDLDTEGHVYVTDGRYDVIQVFTGEGDFLLSIGGPGNGPGEFHMPVGLHIDANDEISVVDRLNRRIQVLRYVGGKSE